MNEKAPNQDPTRLPASKDSAFIVMCHLRLALGV